MLRRIDLSAAGGSGYFDNSDAGSFAALRRVLPRAKVDVREAVLAVTPLVEAVAERGYAAAREATLRFDGVDVPTPRVPVRRTRGRPRRSRSGGASGPAGIDPPRAAGA